VRNSSKRQFDAVQEVNTRGTWLLARAAYPDLVAAGNGSLITVTSVTVAILGMTRALAREWGPDGIRVTR
jgi:3-oxoacyl-[acyl-carrier protein] reductase